MKLTLKIKILILSTTSWALAASNNHSCFNFYNSSNKISLSQRIQTKLVTEKNSFPDLLISETLRQELASLTAKYDQMMSTLDIKGPKNEAQFALQTISEVLNHFNKVSIKLSTELEKEKVNRKKVEEDSKDLTHCLGNLRVCEVNAVVALEKVRVDIVSAKELLVELNQQTEELKLLGNDLLRLTDLPVEVIHAIQRTQVIQSTLIEQYALNLTKALELFKNLEVSLRVQSADVQNALLEIALLQAKGAKIETALDLKAMDAPTAEHLTFSGALKDNAFAKTVSESTNTKMGTKLLSELSTIKFEKKDGVLLTLYDFKSFNSKFDSNLGDLFSHKDIINIIEQILLDANLVNHSSLASSWDLKDTFMAPHYYSIRLRHDFKGETLHYLFFLINGFNINNYKDFILWLVTKIDSTISELNSEKGHAWIFNQKHRHLNRLKKMSDSYKQYLNSKEFKEDFIILRDAVADISAFYFKKIGRGGAFDAHVRINFIKLKSE